MNQKQRVFNMLAKTSKTQLSKGRKVNLAIADEAADAIREMEDATSELYVAINNTQSAVNDITRSLQEAIGLAPGLDQVQDSLNAYNVAFNKANQVADKFKNAADALGIDPYDSQDFSGLVDAIEGSTDVTMDALRTRDQADDLIDLIADLQGKI
jgi:hypothetical protein